LLCSAQLCFAKLNWLSLAKLAKVRLGKVRLGLELNFRAKTVFEPSLQAPILHSLASSIFFGENWKTVLLNYSQVINSKKCFCLGSFI